MSRTWSAQQVMIFDWFRNPGEHRNLMVRARAGTGKTTTIIEAVRHAPEESILLAAFNKKIATELQTRVNESGGAAEAKTLHGVGFGIVQRYWEKVKLDSKRGYDLAKRAAGDQAPDEMIAKVQKLASIAKGMVADLDPFTLLDTLMEIVEAFDLEPDEQWAKDGFGAEWLCQKAQRAMELACRRDDGDDFTGAGVSGGYIAPRIDFDDMIYLPVAMKWARPRYDLVVIDEAQDMNATQLKLAMSVVTPNGRVAVVGDDRQAIYGFRGADSSALDRLKKELTAHELGLKTTYRCGQVIVDYARQLVPDFQADLGNPAGMIESLHMTELPDTARVGDFVLSRINAPLVSVCLKLLRRGVPARIEGKDVAAGLKSIVKRWKPRDMQGLLDQIEKWKEREIEKAKKKQNTAAAKEAEITDKADVLVALCDGLTNPAELMVRLDTMFGDAEDNRRPMVVCSSIHRAKGLEADRVFLLKHTLYPQRKYIQKITGCTEAEAMRKAKAIVEEQNLEYVGVTRAKNVLVWVNG